MKALKIAGAIVGVAIIALLAVYGGLRAGLGQTNLEAARRRWAAPPSAIVAIDGVPLHVRDEGQGPTVVMLHGSIVNLHEWDPVANRLKSRFRVVRLDWPPYGFSGADPSGVYTTKRASDLLAGLVDKLQLPPFVLVATSNGVNVALQYVDDHPGKARALAISIPPVERPSQTRKISPLMKFLVNFHARWLPNWHSHLYYREIFKDTAGPGFEPPRALVDMTYDADNLPGAVQHQKRYIDSNTHLFKTMDVGAMAGKVTVPTLIQWCDRDTVISQSPKATVARFSNAPVTLIEYPDIGHFPMWENPDLFTRDLAGWIDKLPAVPAVQ